MTKRKLTKHEDDIRRNLRKSAEINPAQSPHDGIHTCSKGCKKPGCNRGLRETIEDLEQQVRDLMTDLKRQACELRRITKAGDDMADILFQQRNLKSQQSVTDWECAKEGRPTE